MGKTPSPIELPSAASYEDRYLVPGLVRGLKVLRAFSPERREMSLSEIAGHLGMTRSAAFRAVYTLNHLGYLMQDSRSRLYRLGPAVMALGYGLLASRELVEIALPELERLRDETDWSAHLGVRDGRSVLYLLRVPSRMGLASIVHVGSRLPAVSTTMGRVLLADLDEPTLIALYRDAADAARGGTGGWTPQKVLAQHKVDRDAETIVQAGRFESGVTAIATAVRDMSGQAIAAINVTTTAPPDDAARPFIRRQLLDAAGRIARQLGAG
ncbi:MAG: IclR family transcriptional regulator [Roseitalea sp.]|jgi:DNA-binding IclR family transcriptional regulator|nr:IclR family transcriptional regulator [Roseitalea sp.]MBO6723340.1 IclR family transcriptional regulator [Roseitalea sp.]MBO6741772.1 IclR family transcriptional regulator [Roseitalea sp.]